MDILTSKIKNDFKLPIVIDKTSFLPGEQGEVKIPVGRMPSDTRLYVNTFVFRSKHPGPTLYLQSGVHGDEINGIEINNQLLKSGVFDNLLRGNVIIIPLLNVFGFNNFSRDVPDGKDVNRSFPGILNGSLASRVARTVTKNILPFVDLAIDLHTGGASRFNHPQVRFYGLESNSQQIANQFNAPLSIHQFYIPKSFRKACKDLNIPAVVYEAGESIRLDGNAIEIGKRGILRVMAGLDMINLDANSIESQEIPNKLIMDTDWLRAKQSGIFIWAKSAGDVVKKGTVLGVIKDPYASKYNEVVSKLEGTIIGHNNASVVSQGDALFHIGTKYANNGF